MSFHRKNCKVCNKEFSARIRTQLYCSNKCKKHNEHIKYKKSIENRPNFPKSKVGDITELEVSAYFLKKGYEVFRNVSSSGPADLVIWNPNDNSIHLIDTKTYHYNPENVESYVKNTQKDNGVKIVPYNLSEQIVYDEITL